MKNTDKIGKTKGGGYGDYLCDFQRCIYATKYGAVEIVLDEEDDNTSISFVINGINYNRKYDKLYSQRYAVTLAKRFAKEKWEEYENKGNALHLQFLQIAKEHRGRSRLSLPWSKK